MRKRGAVTDASPRDGGAKAAKRDGDGAEDRGAEDRRRVKEAEARLDFLLAQSDVFKHFGAGKKKAAAQRQGPLEVMVSPSKRRQREGSVADDDDDDEPEEPPAADAWIVTRQPTCVTGQMRPYQLEGLKWLVRLHEHGVNGILADEMGLGKTLQCISYLGWLAETKAVQGPHLVLVPKSTLANWIDEFKRWCPSALRAVPFHGTKQERAVFVRDTLLKRYSASEEEDGRRCWDVIVTTYETANTEASALEKVAWEVVVIDEAHRIKNEASKFSQTARRMRAARRLLVTGTPLQNNLHELWALLNYLLPDLFGDAAEFDSHFDLVGADSDDDAKRHLIAQLHKLLRPFMLRRLKAEVEKTMPPKREIWLKTPLSPLQRDCYKGLLRREVAATPGLVVGDAPQRLSRQTLNNIIMHLRKCCNHPYLLPNVEDRTLDPLGDHVVHACAKLKLLDKLLAKLHATGHRVVLFSQMTSMLDVLEDLLVMRDYDFCRIDGATSYSDRDDAISSFNAPASTNFVFLISTRAGGLGINLQTADTVVLYDSDWNPQMDLQAMDRCHRIGQTKPVTVYRLITEGTVEEKIVERAQQKLKLEAVVVQQGRLAADNGAAKGNGALTNDDLLAAVKYGANAIFHGAEAADVVEEDIDTILKRSEAAAPATEVNKAPPSDLLKFGFEGEASCQQFEGVDYSVAENRRGSTTRAENNDDDTIALINALTEAEVSKPRAVKLQGAAALAPHTKNNDAPATKMAAAAAAAAAAGTNPVPAKRRLPRLDEWTLYEDPDRLREIGALERAAYGALKAADRATAPTVLDPVVDADRTRLLATGFNWTRATYEAWVKHTVACGRNAHAKVADLMGLPEDDVRDYAAAFWSRGEKHIADWDKVVGRIDRADLKRMQTDAELANLGTLVAMYDEKFPAASSSSSSLPAAASDFRRRPAMEVMRVDVGSHVEDFERKFSRAADRFIACAAVEFQGDGHRIAAALRSAVATTATTATTTSTTTPSTTTTTTTTTTGGRFLFDAHALSRPPEALAARARDLARKADSLAAAEVDRRAKVADLEAKVADLDAKIDAAQAADVAQQARVHFIRKKIRLSGIFDDSRAPFQFPPIRPLEPFLCYVAAHALEVLDATSLDHDDHEVIADAALAELEHRWNSEPDAHKLTYDRECRDKQRRAADDADDADEK